MSKYQVVFSIVNAGCHEQVMACAREAGATGGTVIHARGTSNPLAASKFGIGERSSLILGMTLKHMS